jgi:hypothetical protein
MTSHNVDIFFGPLTPQQRFIFPRLHDCKSMFPLPPSLFVCKRTRWPCITTFILIHNFEICKTYILVNVFMTKCWCCISKYFLAIIINDEFPYAEMSANWYFKLTNWKKTLIKKYQIAFWSENDDIECNFLTFQIFMSQCI